MGNIVAFLPTAKYESFLQIYSITLGMHSLPFPKYQNKKLVISLQYLKENVKDKIDFYLQIKIKGILN